MSLRMKCNTWAYRETLQLKSDAVLVRRWYLHPPKCGMPTIGIRAEKYNSGATIDCMPSPHRATSLVASLVYGFAAVLERYQVLAVACYSAFFLVVCGLLSATKLMWYDELATYYPAKLPTGSAVIDYFEQGNDVHTPLASLAAWAAMRMFGDGPVVDRFPFTLGYLIFCVCIFVFIARRSPAVYAAAGMIFPALTLMFFYATELRPYGLVLGCAGLALVCWQAASENIARPFSVAGLWVSLLIAISSHYYAVFLLIPFTLAELSRTWVRRRIDWQVWFVLISSPSVLLIFLKGMHAALSIYPKEMQPPHLGQMLTTYLILLSISNAPILGAIIACILIAPSLSRPAPPSFGQIPLPDWVLAGTLALLPVFTVPAALKLGAFNERYVLPTVAGVAIILMFGLARSLKGDPLVGAVLTLFFLFWFVGKTLPEVRRQMHENGGLKTPLGQPLQENWKRELEQSDLPVAMSPAPLFLQMQHYVSGAARAQIYYVSDEQKARLYNDAPTDEINMVRFSRAVSLQVVGYHEFVRQHPHFLVYTEAARLHWLIPSLIREGARIRLRKPSDSHPLYEVTMPQE